MMNRPRLLSAAYLLAIFVVSCSPASSPGPPTQATQRSPSVNSLRELFDIIDFNGTAEITYRSSGAISGGGPGVVIWRQNGSLSRWDTLPKESDSPTQGRFVVRRTDPETHAFGCSWVAVPDDRTKIRADCAAGDNAGSIMEIAVGTGALPLFRGGEAATRAGDRTVLGHPVPCYSAGPIEEICIDDRGRVLYFAQGSGANATVFEATTVIDAIESFDWPFDSPNSPTASTIEEIQDAGRLQLPAAFHLPG